MTVGWGLALLAVALVVLIATAWAVRRWDRVSLPTGTGWAAGLLRSLLLLLGAALAGIFATDDGSWSQGVMFAVAFSLLPILYSEIGVTPRRYRLEVTGMWAAWTWTAWHLAGLTGEQMIPLALFAWLLCVTFGAVVTRLGLRRAWDWDSLWGSKD